MKVKIQKKNKEIVKEVIIPKGFITGLNEDNISEYINSIRSNIRKNVASSKDRSEVSGSGKKPWRQKGTGRSRHGSIRSPLWVGGGVCFGPNKGRNYTMRINKKTKKYIKKSIFAYFMKNNKFMVISDLTLNKTRDADKVLRDLDLEGKISVILDPAENKNEIQSMRNIPYVCIHHLDSVDYLNLVSSDYIVATPKILDKLIGEK